MGGFKQKPRILTPGLAKSEWENWLAIAKAGESCVYFRGLNLGDIANPDTPEAVKLAFAAGFVELAQRRCEDGKLDYLAIKKGVPRKPLVCGHPWRVKLVNDATVYLR
jgi:hypothetical protein